MDFFQTAGRNLTATEVAAGVRHHLARSVIGTDQGRDAPERIPGPRSSEIGIKQRSQS
jgi:hypothetical protein